MKHHVLAPAFFAAFFAALFELCLFAATAPMAHAQTCEAVFSERSAENLLSSDQQYESYRLTSHKLAMIARHAKKNAGGNQWDMAELWLALAQAQFPAEGGNKITKMFAMTNFFNTVMTSSPSGLGKRANGAADFSGYDLHHYLHNYLIQQTLLKTLPPFSDFLKSTPQLLVRYGSMVYIAALNSPMRQTGDGQFWNRIQDGSTGLRREFERNVTAQAEVLAEQLGRPLEIEEWAEIFASVSGQVAAPTMRQAIRALERPLNRESADTYTHLWLTLGNFLIFDVAGDLAKNAAQAGNPMMDESFVHATVTEMLGNADHPHFATIEKLFQLAYGLNLDPVSEKRLRIAFRTHIRAHADRVLAAVKNFKNQIKLETLQAALAPPQILHKVITSKEIHLAQVSGSIVDRLKHESKTRNLDAPKAAVTASKNFRSVVDSNAAVPMEMYVFQHAEMREENRVQISAEVLHKIARHGEKLSDWASAFLKGRARDNGESGIKIVRSARGDVWEIKRLASSHRILVKRDKANKTWLWYVMKDKNEIDPYIRGSRI